MWLDVLDLSTSYVGQPVKHFADHQNALRSNARFHLDNTDQTVERERVNMVHS
jgi:hypothetical protein